MKSLHVLSQQVETLYGRLSHLCENIALSPVLPSELLPIVLKELGVASEKVQVLIKELTEHSEERTTAQDYLAAEHQRYQRFFELVPDSYLITDETGIIQAVNRAAAELLNVQPRSLVGKPFSTLVYPEDGASLQAKLAHIAQHQSLEISVRLFRQFFSWFNASLVVHVIRHPQEDSTSLYWRLQDVTTLKRAEAALMHPAYDPCQDRPLQSFGKGDSIDLDPQTLWLVADGTVKLSTTSDCGTDSLVGLAGVGAVFGSTLTGLSTYQAISLTETRLGAISLAEVSQSPRLAQVLLPAIQQRLRQTEGFLSIYGQIRVEDRLQRLLELLKQEIGQPVEGGTCLTLRLTHQDFASACCTTRVTVTRLLRKLHVQGKITFDSRNHLVIRD